MKNSKFKLWFLFITLVVATTVHAQNTSIIKGKITDLANGDPLVGASVVIANTNLGIFADLEGNYSFKVPSGQHTIRVSFVGYTSVFQYVQVKEGETLVENFELSPDILNMSEVVITGTGGMPVEKSRLGNAISVISTKDLQLIPTRSLTQTLNSRTTGIQVWNSGGLLGTTSLIQLRGIGSLTGNTAPLIYVDGVRVSNTNSYSIAGGKIRTIDGKDQQSISSLNLLNPTDIDRVEILKGASAATLYGSDAANGVIQIFTKTGIGEIGKSNWSYSTSVTNYDWSIYDSKFSRAAKEYVRQGNSMGLQNQLSTGGRAEGFNYFAAVSWSNTNNGIKASNQENFDIKSNFSFKINEASDLKIGATYSKDNTSRPDADNASQSTSGFFSQIMKLDSVSAEQAFKNPFSAIQFYAQSIYDKVHNDYENGRTSGFLNYSLKLPFDLKFTLNSGFEEMSLNQLRWIEYGFINSITGSRATQNNRISSFNGQAILGGNYRLLPELDLAASIGIDYYRTKTSQSYNGSGLFVPGFDNSLQFGDQTTYVINELETTYSSGAMFAQSQLSYLNRLFLTLGLRADKSSSFGAEASARWYPKASLAYLLPVEESLPFFNMARIRGSFGQAGNQPDPGAADLTFLRQALAVNYTGVVIEKPGETTLKPSRTTELELGFDLSALNNRIGFEVTYYHQQVMDDLFAVQTKPSDGYGSRLQVYNLGEIETTGFEFAIFGTPIDFTNFGWTTRINMSTVNNKVLNDGGFAFTTSPFQSLAYLRVEKDHPIGEFYYAGIDCDQYGNVVTLSETYRGKTATPKITGNWSNDFNIYRNLTVSVNFGWSLDFAVMNLTLANMHRNGRFDDDFTEADYTAGLAASKKTATARTANEIAALTKYNFQTNSNSPVFLQDGDFFKLREVAVNYSLPTDWYQSFGLKGINLTLSAFNVFTITKYKGFDPEVSVGGSTLLARGADNRSIPTPRSIVFKINLQF